jgi:cell division transport system ATP-binding protein
LERVDYLVSIKNLSLNQAEHLVLSDVCLDVSPGEFIYLIGKTGSGKSSLLRALYGDIQIKSGSAEVCGIDLAGVHRKNVHLLRRKLGIVFQDFGLLTDRTVGDNLNFALKATGWSKQENIKNRIDEVLARVELANKGYKFPHELSGGEQQRVAIARALLNSPALILADEPTGNLDPDTTRNILKLLHDLVASGCSVIMATHDHHNMENFPGKMLKCEDGQISTIA